MKNSLVGDLNEPGIFPNTAKELRGLTPEQLAVYQQRHVDKSAQWVLAEKEWERRAILETAFWNRMSAWIGVVGAIAGSLITIAGAILLKAILPD